MSISRRPQLATDKFRHRASNTFVEAATDTLIASVQNSFPGHVSKANRPGNIDVLMLLRAATSPATTSSPNWPGSLASTAVVDLIDVLSGESAAASVLGLGHQFTFDHATGLLVPGVVVDDPNIVGFAGEGMPLPAKGSLGIEGLTLLLRKFGVLIPVTREIFQHSTPTIEAIVRLALMQALALALDAALFSNTAGSSLRPPGLLLGISPLTPSTATAPQDAMIADIAALATAVAPIAGNKEVVLVAAPAAAVTLRLRQTREVYPVLASSALASGTVVAVAPNGLASAIDPVPRFEIASEGALVLDDAAGPISSVGTPNVVSAPTVSLFQSDTLGLRVVLQVAWGLRSSAAVAWMSGVSW